MKEDDIDRELESILRDVQNNINSTIGMLLEKHGEQASLAIPAIMLKTTLQIYTQTLSDERAVKAVIQASMDSLSDLPPLVQNSQTIH